MAAVPLAHCRHHSGLHTHRIASSSRDLLATTAGRGNIFNKGFSVATKRRDEVLQVVFSAERFLSLTLFQETMTAARKERPKHVTHCRKIISSFGWVRRFRVCARSFRLDGSITAAHHPQGLSLSLACMRIVWVFGRRTRLSCAVPCECALSLHLFACFARGLG